MKFGLNLSLILALVIFAAWHFTRPPSSSHDTVEGQLHAFGPQLVPALAPTSAFTKTAVGYQPKPESPQAPAGLKPQELQAWTAFAQRHSGEPALAPTFPELYSAGTQVRSQGMAVTLKPLGQQPRFRTNRKRQARLS